MRVLETRLEVREALTSVRQQGLRVGLVPTMGFLHEGHLALVDRARELAEYVALSVFVNPLQFSPTEDLNRYPRDLERDCALAAGRGVELLFAPGVREMYPDGAPWVAVVPERGADRLCGAARPGHFRGVLTVVAKLFGIIHPDVAVFGQKDFQQAALIRRMVHDLEIPVEIVVASTVREADGLALSSRNAYLSEGERERATALYAALARCEALFDAGEMDAKTLRAAMRRHLSREGVALEYAEVVHPETLEPVRRAEPGSVCAVAARIGTTRLIDNLILGADETPGASSIRSP
jgi:pantoate--beta-alanine ligase